MVSHDIYTCLLLFLMYCVERIDYHTQMRRSVRSQPLRRIHLLSLANEVEGESHPLLPLVSDDPNAFRRSPLHRLLNTNQDEDEMAAAVMGPGPWAFHHELQLPENCSLINFSNRNKKSNITITHTLKIVFRVERGDDDEIDPRTRKRKLFDILIQTPVHILSVSSSCMPFQGTSLKQDMFSSAVVPQRGCLSQGTTRSYNVTLSADVHPVRAVWEPRIEHTPTLMAESCRDWTAWCRPILPLRLRRIARRRGTPSRPCGHL